MKIKLFILTRKYFIKSPQKEQGNTLVMTMMIGFSLMTLSTMMLASSSNLQINIKASISNRQEKAVAERAITRFQELISQNPEIALYPDCATSRDSNGQCQDSTTENSWFRADNILPPSNLCGTTTTNAQATTISNKASNQNWYAINSLNPQEGEYRLISYEYSPNVGVTPGTGTLTIEARTKQNNINSISRIEVAMPIVDGTSSGTNTFTKGLWFNLNKASDVSGGSSQIQSNIVDSTCPVDNDSNRVDKFKLYQQAPQMTDGNSYTYTVNEGEPFPSLPTAGQSPPTGTGVNTLLSITGSISLPQAGDVEVNNTYTYNLTETGKSIDIGSGDVITIDGGANKTIVLYLNGEASIQGSLIVNGGSKLIIYAHNKVILDGSVQNNSGTADFVQLYHYDSSNKITSSGGIITNMFIFAPNSLVELSGGSSFTGTIWSNAWKASGDSLFDQGDTNLANLSLPTTTKPTITGVTSWARKGQQSPTATDTITKTDTQPEIDTISPPEVYY